MLFVGGFHFPFELTADKCGDSDLSSEAIWRKGWLLSGPFWGSLLAVYWVALFTLTHLPSNPVLTHVVTVKDKSAHTIAFGLLAALLAFVVCLVRRRFGIREAVACGVGLALYAGFDELTQPIVGRSCDIYDWAADLIGIAGGLTFIWTLVVVWRGRQDVATPQ